MSDRSFDGDDSFRRRLKEALERVPPRSSTPAAPEPRDEFDDRVRRAIERARDSGAKTRSEPGAAEALPRSGDANDDLQVVVESWPHLPGSVRSFIVTMVQAKRNPPAAA